MLKLILNFWLDKAHWFTFLFTILIIISSLISTSTLKVSEIGISDKILHLLSYMVLMWNWMMLFKQRSISHKSMILLIGLALFGIIIEMLQGYITVSRTPDWKDEMANIMGLIIGLISFSPLFNRLLDKKEC